MPGSKPCALGCDCWKHHKPKLSDKEYQERRNARARDRRRTEPGFQAKSRAYTNNWARQQPPGWSWVRGIKIRHGMTPEAWQAMWDEQNGLCYLGAHPLPEDPSKTAVDHDHTHCPPGRSCAVCRRGLACPTCNQGIGLLGDSPDQMRIAADALERAQRDVSNRRASTTQVEPLW